MNIHERRSQGRISSDIDAEVTRQDTHESQVLRIRDISLGGVCFEDAIYPLRTRLRITPREWPNDIEPLVGEVVHVCEQLDQPRLSGVRFTRLTRVQRQTLIALCYQGRDPMEQSGPVNLAELSPEGFSDGCEFSVAFPHAFLLANEQKRKAPVISPQTRVHAVRSLSRENVWQSISVGREDTCDIVIDHRRVSRNHAVFERDPVAGDYLLLDRGSHNGTRVDGRKLAPMVPLRLKSGSGIDFAGVEFWFLSAQDLFERLRELPAAPQGVAWKG